MVWLLFLYMASWFAVVTLSFDVTRSQHHVSSARTRVPSTHSHSKKGYILRSTRTQQYLPLSVQLESNALQLKDISFVSPLLEDGYSPAVIDYQNRTNEKAEGTQKPLLLYLPGFDGTILAPFIQFPSLGESFDVRGMKVGMENRCTFDELKSIVLDYILLQSNGHEELYLMGESFGGILAIEVARDIRSVSEYKHVTLKGLTLVNPATSYLRSALFKLGPPIANQSISFFPMAFVWYLFSLTSQLVPLFLDEGKALQQLVLILSSKGLPVVLNTPEREAYMGRVAFDLVNRLKFMPQDTLKWRLEEWLERGCTLFEEQLEMSRQSNGDIGGLDSLKSLDTLIVVGELDLTLPSVEEAKRLASTVFDSAKIHVVEGAGHASTCGSSVQLIQLMRNFFSDLIDHTVDNNSFDSSNDEELCGLVPRYDGASIGMSPLNYWNKEYYRNHDIK